jgi:hypothetical protein
MPPGNAQPRFKPTPAFSPGCAGMYVRVPEIHVNRHIYRHIGLQISATSGGEKAPQSLF